MLPDLPQTADQCPGPHCKQITLLQETSNATQEWGCKPSFNLTDVDRQQTLLFKGAILIANTEAFADACSGLWCRPVGGRSPEQNMSPRAAPCMHPHIPSLGHFVGQLIILLVVAPYQHLIEQPCLSISKNRQESLHTVRHCVRGPLYWKLRHHKANWGMLIFQGNTSKLYSPLMRIY